MHNQCSQRFKNYSENFSHSRLYANSIVKNNDKRIFGCYYPDVLELDIFQALTNISNYCRLKWLHCWLTRRMRTAEFFHHCFCHCHFYSQFKQIMDGYLNFIPQSTLRKICTAATDLLSLIYCFCSRELQHFQLYSQELQHFWFYFRCCSGLQAWQFVSILSFLS